MMTAGTGRTEGGQHQGNKKPAQGGFFCYRQSWSEQTSVFLAVVSAADNEGRLERRNVASCRTFSAIFNGEGNFLSFIKRFVVITLDSRKVYEYIFATVVWSNEAKTFI